MADKQQEAGSPFDWETLHYTRSEIARLEARLVELYRDRKELIAQMAASGIKQREIGAYWGISNPRVTQILTGRRGRR